MNAALRFSPAAERNREPILAALSGILPAAGRVLEVASGTGQHVVHFAAAWPGIEWQPSDAEPDALPDIDARVVAARLQNVRPAVTLDVLSGEWPSGPFDAVFCSNMIHIAPWACTHGLLEGASNVLADHASLVLYGPFLRATVPTAPGNLAFDIDLKSRNAEWGIRDLDTVAGLASGLGLVLESVAEMPANNLLVRFVRSPKPHRRPSE